MNFFVVLTSGKVTVFGQVRTPNARARTRSTRAARAIRRGVDNLERARRDPRFLVMRNHDPEPRFALPVPAVVPVLDRSFRPAASAWRAFEQHAREPGGRSRRASRSSSGTVRSPASPPTFSPRTRGADDDNFRMLERLVKARALGARRFPHPPRRAGRARRQAAPALSRHRHRTLRLRGRWRARQRSPDRSRGHRGAAAGALEHRGSRRASQGRRIGFDLGGSDRKVAALIDGRVVWSEEKGGIPPPARPRLPLERDHRTRSAALPSTSRTSTRLAAAPPASTSTAR